MSQLPLSAKCIKYLLFTFNLLFVITGIILLSVGSTVHGIYGNYHHLLHNGGYLSTSAFLIAIGLIIFIIAFFGCCGAVKENFCMTITFTTLLIIIFIFEFAAGISGFVLRDGTLKILEETINGTMALYVEKNEESIRTMDFLQMRFNCCGIHSPQDWAQFINNTDLPISCCESGGYIGNITCQYSNSSDFRSTGCVTAFGEFVQGHAITIGGVALAIAFVQLVGIIFSCHLSKQIKQYQTV